VIKTCCGCLSTKNGTYAVLFIHMLGYLASIIQLGINVGGDQLETFWNSTVLTTQVYSECGTTNYNDIWRCATLKDVGLDTHWVAIGLIIAASFLLVASIVAVVGTVKDSPWLLMPWVVLDFLSFLTKLIIAVMGVMMWSISLKAGANADTSFLIGVTILVAVGLALSFYMWLCVVSHFQSLKELKELGFLDSKGGNDVRPFVMPAGSVSEGSEGGTTATEEIKSVNSGDGSDDGSDSDSDGSSSDSDDSDSDNGDVETPKDDSDAGDGASVNAAASAAAAKNENELSY